MQSRLILNVVLALVLVGLVLLAIYEPGKAPPPAPAAISQLKAEAVSRLQIIRPEHEAVVFVKSATGWRMQTPYDMPAAQQKLANLLALLTAQSHGQYEFSAVDTQALGLDQPQLMLRFDQELMAFGGTEALHGRRYVQAGNTIHLITDRYSYLAQGEPASLVSTRLLQADEKLEAITAPEFSLRRDLEKGAWQLQGAPLDSADARQAFADAWQHARAIKLKASQADLTASGDTVAIQISGREMPLQFQLIRSDAHVILRRRDKGLDYYFTPEVAAQLLQPKASTAAEK